MKAIMVMFDSLNKWALAPYGETTVITPNFQRLAEKTVTFDGSYVGSMPCMPARRELHTGRLNMLHRSWGPIEPYDDSMPEILKENGIYTHLVSDHVHYWEDGGATYHQRYSSWENIRGQEGDPWIAVVDKPDLPNKSCGRVNGQELINREIAMREEEDYAQAQTFKKGLEFLERNKNADNWFLQIETFDPHEPFYVPKKYWDMYPDDDCCEDLFFDWPSYAPVKESEKEISHVRRKYKALVTMCDHYLGTVLDFMDEHDMWKDTMLIVNCDHGFMLGEHEWWGKLKMPYFEQVARTPLFIWNPKCGIAGEHRGSLVQMIDMAPTLLNYFGVSIPDDMEGKSLDGVIECDEPVREAVLFGQHGGQLNVSDGRYVYMRAPATPDNQPLSQYTLVPIHMRNFFTKEEMDTAELVEPFTFTKGMKVLKTKSKGFMATSKDPNLAFKLPYECLMEGGKESEVYRNYLFDLEKDPQQNHPIEDPLLEERMIRKMVDLMMKNDAPYEQYIRLGLEEYL